MISLTRKEREAIILLFKDFTTFYNANSISKLLDISHVGSQKILKRLLRENLLISKTIGKSIIYKLNLDNDYAKKLISFLLADEANNFQRWKEEFKELYKENRIVAIFGSAIRNYTKAKDIDIMIIIGKEEAKEISSIIKEKEKILPKNLHAVKLTHKDLSENLKGKNKAMIDIVKTAIILYGQDKYVEVIKNVAGF